MEWSDASEHTMMVSTDSSRHLFLGAPAVSAPSASARGRFAQGSANATYASLRGLPSFPPPAATTTYCFPFTM